MSVRRITELDRLEPLNLPEFVKGPILYEAENKILTSSEFNVVYNKKNLKPVGTFKNDYKLADPADGINAVEEMLRDDSCPLDLSGITREMYTSHNEAQMKVVWTIPAETIDIGVGDVCALAITHKNSWNGIWGWSIGYDVERLACSNGMTVPTSIWGYKKKNTLSLDPDYAKRKLREIVASFRGLEHIWKKWRETPVSDKFAVQSIAKAAQTKIPEFGGGDYILGSELREFHDSRAIKANQSYRFMWERYSEHERLVIGENQWALFNAMTNWATHAPASNDDDNVNILSIRERRNKNVLNVINSHEWKTAA